LNFDAHFEETHSMPALSISLSRKAIGRIYQASLAVAALLALPGIPLRAQTDTGSIVGIVQDKGNARLAGATVAVTDTATSVTHTFVTNNDGEYEALQLIPGTYSVTASQSGFSTQVRQNVAVNVQSRIQVDFAMTVSSVQQQVVVNEDTAQLETQSAAVAAVLSTQTINELPLNGRDYDQLALLEPGIYHDPSNEVANSAEGRFSSNGNLELQNYF
jgi:hypothetical protein